MPMPKRPLKLVALAGTGAVAAGLIARRAARSRGHGDPETAGLPGSFVDVDGIRIHLIDVGQGDAVVLLHGWNGSTFSMRHIVSELARYYRVIAIDLPGYGYSSRSEDADYTAGGQAATVRKVMDKLRVDRATVLGHSMGGGVAARLATKHPELIDKVVLVSSVTPTETQRARHFSFLIGPLTTLFGAALIRESVVRRVLRGIVHDPGLVTPELVEGYLRPLLVQGHLRAQAKQLAMRRHEEPYDPRAIRQPVLLLWGEHDRVIPLSRGLELADEIPNAQLAIVRGAGHLALEEQPEECNRLLLQFLGRPRGGAASGNGAIKESPSPVS